MLNLKSLNPEQVKAVEHDKGPSIILAGPGTGKTRTLTYKVANLIDGGMEPENILFLTTSTRAAQVLREGVKDLIGSKADYIHAGTFHSVFAKILRAESDAHEYSPRFTINDREDSTSIVDNIAGYLNISLDKSSALEMMKKISYYKNQYILPANYKKMKSKLKGEFDDDFAKIYDEYEKKLAGNDTMDFDDLVIKPLQLFDLDKKILNKYKRLFKFILIDDFHNITIPQFQLLLLLTSKSGKLTVAADENASINNIMGGSPDHITKFKEEYPRAKTFKLEQNYRSTKKILQALDSVIQNNEQVFGQKITTENKEGDILSLIKCSDEKEEAYQIARFIKDEVHSGKLSLKDFAVLFRTGAQARAIEDVFKLENIPFLNIGGIEFYQKKEVKDIVAYLRVIVNQRDEESLLRIMNFPQRGIGMTTIKRMLSFAQKHEISVFDTMSRVFEVIDIKERIQKNVKNFKLLLDKYIGLKDKLSLEELTRALIDELGLIRMFREEHSIESIAKLENVEAFLANITEFAKEHPKANLDDYLQKVTMSNDLELLSEDKNVVSIMTIDFVQGLEFPIVFVSGLEEEVFPLAEKFQTGTTVEEERRLFYVAVSRAKEKVYLSHSRSRYRFGEVAYQNRSRFIDEIDESCIKEVEQNANRKITRKTKKEMYYEFFENMDYQDLTKTNLTLKIGSRVMHEKFGLGKIVQTVSSGENQKVTVVFEGNNIKQLMLKYAKLKVLN